MPARALELGKERSRSSVVGDEDPSPQGITRGAPREARPEPVGGRPRGARQQVREAMDREASAGIGLEDRLRGRAADSAEGRLRGEPLVEPLRHLDRAPVKDRTTGRGTLAAPDHQQRVTTSEALDEPLGPLHRGVPRAQVRARAHLESQPAGSQGTHKRTEHEDRNHSTGSAERERREAVHHGRTLRPACGVVSRPRVFRGQPIR